MSRIVIPAKAPAETQRIAFDFTSNLLVSETISTAVASVAVWSGTDASPSSMVSGSATISGQIVYQKFTGGTVGVVYIITMTITTSLSQTLIQQAYLAVMNEAGV